jgi:aryl-alcohol dehydrogenase (NADP+)
MLCQLYLFRMERQHMRWSLVWLGRNSGRRDEIVLASKIAGPGRRDWIRNGNTRVDARTIPWAIDDSLRRLQTDHIDLYQIHWPERYVPMFGAWQYDVTQQRECTPILEQIEALAAAMRAGKIRAYGLSNETCFGVCEFVRLARENGLPPPASIQNGYSLLMRTATSAVLWLAAQDRHLGAEVAAPTAPTPRLF